MKLGIRVAAASALAAGALAAALLSTASAQAAEDGTSNGTAAIQTVVQPQTSTGQAARADTSLSQNRAPLYRFTYYCGDGHRNLQKCRTARATKQLVGYPVSGIFFVDCSAGCTAPGVRHGWAFRWG